MERDPYRILQVSRTASLNEIQSAYRKLARTYHPDVNASPSATERMRDINWAYDLLKDPQKRRQYDMIHDYTQAASTRQTSRPAAATPPGPAYTAPRPAAQNQQGVNHDRGTGCWVTVLLFVVVQSISTLFRAADQRTPTFYLVTPPVIYATSTPQGFPCVHWSEVTMEDNEKEVCVYGVAQNTHASQNRYYTTFGQDTRTFSIIADQALPEDLLGTCVQARGTVQQLSGVLVIYVEGQRLASCGTHPKVYYSITEE